MNRKIILEAAEQAATAKGYTFYTGSNELMRSMVKSLPAVWLAPPKFISIDGRRHGKITYEVVLHAMCRDLKSAPEVQNRNWTRLEEDLVEIFSRISQHEKVATVNDLAIRCIGSTSSAFGEEGVTATAEVVTLF